MCQLQISVDMDITLNRMTLEKLKYFKRFINKNTLLPTPFSIDYGVESSIFLLAGLSGAAVIIFFILYQYYYTYKLGLFKEKHIWKSLGEFDNEGSPEDSARIDSKFKWIFSKAAARQLKYPARRLRNSNIVVLYASTGEILWTIAKTKEKKFASFNYTHCWIFKPFRICCDEAWRDMFEVVEDAANKEKVINDGSVWHVFLIADRDDARMIGILDIIKKRIKNEWLTSIIVGDCIWDWWMAKYILPRPYLAVAETLPTVGWRRIFNVTSTVMRWRQ